MKICEILTLSFIFLIGIVVGAALTNTYGKNAKYSDINIELPEEFKLMENSDDIKGEYDRTTKTFKIWYNN